LGYCFAAAFVATGFWSCCLLICVCAVALLFVMQWVFNNPACNGFTRFPTLGLQALRYSWNFDFQVWTA
jgi:hypothetical protein